MLLSPYSLQWLFLLHMLADAAPAAQPHSLHWIFLLPSSTITNEDAPRAPAPNTCLKIWQLQALLQRQTSHSHHQSQREISYPWEENLAATVVEQSSH
jgi:hypothetical protein